MIYLILYIVFHIICAYVSVCSLIAYLDYHYPTAKNWRKDFISWFRFHLIFGPISLIVISIYTDFFKNGFVWWKSKE
jgi:hypothetical protein